MCCHAAEEDKCALDVDVVEAKGVFGGHLERLGAK